MIADTEARLLLLVSRRVAEDDNGCPILVTLPSRPPIGTLRWLRPLTVEAIGTIGQICSSYLIPKSLVLLAGIQL